jgi:hypothetical protein
MGFHRSLTVGFLLACAPRSAPAPTPVACSRAGWIADSTIAMDGSLVGRWKVWLKADAGLKIGASTDGMLELRSYPAEYHHQTPIYLRFQDTGSNGGPRDRDDRDSIIGWEPRGGSQLYGWSSLELDSVGAATASALTSRQPGAPGVLLSGRHLLLLGPVPLGVFMEDGFQTWLAIDSLGADAFWGHWGMWTAPSYRLTPLPGERHRGRAAGFARHVSGSAV